MPNNVLILDDSSYIKCYKESKKFLKYRKNKKLRGFNIYSIYNIEEVKSKVVRQKVSLVFEGEEFYIRLLALPKVKRTLVDKLVINELTFIFKEIKDFNFAYEIFSRNKNEIKVLVYCINSEKNNLLNTFSDKCNISGIYLIQLCVYKYLKNSLLSNRNVVIFDFNGYTYIMASYIGNIIANAVMKSSSENCRELIEKVQYVINRAREFEREVKTREGEYSIVSININNKHIISELNKFHSYYDFGNLNINIILNRLG